METNESSGSKSSNAKSFADNSVQPAGSAPLLDYSTIGLYVIGTVQSVSALEQRSGVSKSGKNWEKWQQIVCMATDKEMIDVVFSVMGPMPVVDFFSISKIRTIQSVKVRNGTSYNGKMKFDADC